MPQTGKVVSIAELMQASGVQFGTSGARGLVTAMTDEVCYAYMTAFLQHLEQTKQFTRGGEVAIAGDLRHSSPRIMAAAAKAVSDFGGIVVNCGTVPSPAVACFALDHHMPSIMVTGSHIPEDRNGIKFNTARGEILKEDETGIRAQRVTIPAGLFAANGMFSAPSDGAQSNEDRCAYEHYLQRYVNFLPAMVLTGMRVAVYEHSTVGRTVLTDLLDKLGAKVIPVGRSDVFVSVDTEAIRPEDVVLARDWARELKFDAIVSADGDADRPLIGDHTGQWLRGDVAGILCAKYLGAQVVVTPVSSNSAVEKCGWFKAVMRTKIGSPYVIAAMNEALEKDPSAMVVGYEANGGFLTATPSTRDGRTLSALPTRDAVIVVLSILHSAKLAGKKITELVAQLPPRYTASDRVKNFPTELSQARIKGFLAGDAAATKQAVEAVFGTLCGAVKTFDTTDGLRIQFNNDEVVHLRPSGNAPEFRCYNEAASPERAAQLNAACMSILNSWKK